MPQDVVRRRFASGLKNLFISYLDVVDSWQVYDNAGLTGPRLAVQEALMRHKLAGNPVAVWRNGRVEWVQPEDIPDLSSADLEM